MLCVEAVGKAALGAAAVSGRELLGFENESKEKVKERKFKVLEQRCHAYL